MHWEKDEFFIVKTSFLEVIADEEFKSPTFEMSEFSINRFESKSFEFSVEMTELEKFENFES